MGHEILEIPVFAQEWNDAIADLEVKLFSDEYDRHRVQNGGDYEEPFLTSFSRRCLANAAEHLSKRLARTFRDSPRFESEQVALSILKGAANDLRTASQELQQAAQRFKDLGKGTWANQAYLAAKRAQQAAEGLVGSA